MLSVNEDLLPKDYNSGLPKRPIIQKLGMDKFISCWEVLLENFSNVHCSLFKLDKSLKDTLKIGETLVLDPLKKSVIKNPEIIKLDFGFGIIYVRDKIEDGIKQLVNIVYDNDLRILAQGVSSEFVMNEITSYEDSNIGLKYLINEDGNFLIGFHYRFAVYMAIRFMLYDKNFLKFDEFGYGESENEPVINADRFLKTLDVFKANRGSYMYYVSYAQGKVYDNNSYGNIG